jgi:abequosyltransferase
MVSTMPLEQVLLGVCIPTYKRPQQLRHAVRSIIRSAGSLGIPIFLADDSTDDTNAAVINELRNEYPLIHWHRNAVNLGIDGNILNAVNLCTCKYAWLLGEDDRIIPGAIERVMAAITHFTAPPQFILSNYSYVDEDFTMIIRESMVSFTDDHVVPIEEFMRGDAWAVGFIGGCIINKSKWQEVDQSKYIGTYFAHVGTILESLCGGEVLILATPSVYNRVGGANVFTWSGDTYGVYKGWDAMIERLGSTFPEDVCAACADSFRRSTGYGTLRFLAARRADNIFNMHVYNATVRHAPDKNLRYKIAALAIALAPQYTFELARKRLNAKRRQVGREITDPGS